MNSNDNQNNEAKKKLNREERYSMIFGDDDNNGDDVSLESALAASKKSLEPSQPTHETVIVDGDEYDFEIAPATSEAQTFTVSERNNEIVIDGETFLININNDNSVSVEIDGGYGEAQDVDGSEYYAEIDGNYQIARFYDIEIGDSVDSEFEITITPEMIADAKNYRANYPVDVESEF